MHDSDKRTDADSCRSAGAAAEGVKPVEISLWELDWDEEARWEAEIRAIMENLNIEPMSDLGDWEMLNANGHHVSEFIAFITSIQNLQCPRGRTSSA